MNLREEIDRIAREQGREPDALTRELELGLLDAAGEAWGRDRELEARFNEDTNAVDIFQVVHVVERVDPSRAFKEIDLEMAAGLYSDCEVGDELSFQVFYRDEEGEAAVRVAQESSARLLPTLDVLTAGLPFAGRPEWMRPLWPHRRAPWRFGQPVSLPPLRDALDIIARFLDDAGAEVQRGGASLDQLSEARELAPTRIGLVALHERFGPSKDGLGEPLTWRGCALLAIDDALARRDQMNEVMKVLREGGEVGESWWRASWLPMFELDAATVYCLDVSTGSVVKWARDAPATVEAPSLKAWLGAIAVAAQSGLLAWEPRGRGLHAELDPAAERGFHDLLGHVLPGFPRPAA